MSGRPFGAGVVRTEITPLVGACAAQGTRVQQRVSGPTQTSTGQQSGQTQNHGRSTTTTDTALSLPKLCNVFTLQPMFDTLLRTYKCPPCTARVMQASFIITRGNVPPTRSSRGMAISSSPTANATAPPSPAPPLVPNPPPPLLLALPPPLALPPAPRDEDGRCPAPSAFARATCAQQQP